jgi:hypothetical protein
VCLFSLADDQDKFFGAPVSNDAEMGNAQDADDTASVNAKMEDDQYEQERAK